MNNKNLSKILKEFLIMMLGMFIGAASVHFFLKPSGLVIGSISGLAIIFEKMTGIPISILTFAINSVLLILAAILIGKEFGTKTVITSLMLSPYLALFIAKIVNKYFHADMGTSITIAGSLICLTAFLVNDLRLVIIGLIGTYINGLVVNQFAAGFNTKKRACIISDRYEEIQKFIIFSACRIKKFIITIKIHLSRRSCSVIIVNPPAA